MEILNPNTSTQSLGNHTNNTFNGDVTSVVASSHSTNCNNTVPNDNNSLSLAPQSLGLSTDLEKLAGDLERLSKLDIDTLPSGTVNQLASEMSKVRTELRLFYFLIFYFSILNQFYCNELGNM